MKMREGVQAVRWIAVCGLVTGLAVLSGATVLPAQQNRSGEEAGPMKDDGQQGQNDDGQQGQHDDGQQNQKDDGQQG